MLGLLLHCGETWHMDEDGCRFWDLLGVYLLQSLIENIVANEFSSI